MLLMHKVQGSLRSLQLASLARGVAEYLELYPTVLSAAARCASFTLYAIFFLLREMFMIVVDSMLHPRRSVYYVVEDDLESDLVIALVCYVQLVAMQFTT